MAKSHFKPFLISRRPTWSRRSTWHSLFFRETASGRCRPTRQLMSSHYIPLKTLGVRSKGTSFMFKNIEKSPKGTTFAEADKKKWDCRTRDDRTMGQCQRAAVAQSPVCTTSARPGLSHECDKVTYRMRSAEGQSQFSGFQRTDRHATWKLEANRRRFS